MSEMIEVQPAPVVLRDFARWATAQTPKVRTVSPHAFAVPDDLFVQAPEELLIGALVDGRRYRSPDEDAMVGTPPPGAELLGVATPGFTPAPGDPEADAAAMVAATSPEAIQAAMTAAVTAADLAASNAEPATCPIPATTSRPPATSPRASSPAPGATASSPPSAAGTPTAARHTGRADLCPLSLCPVDRTAAAARPATAPAHRPSLRHRYAARTARASWS